MRFGDYPSLHGPFDESDLWPMDNVSYFAHVPIVNFDCSTATGKLVDVDTCHADMLQLLQLIS